MKVKTIRVHTNAYGPHKIGDVYEHRSPATDIAFGYVEELQPPAATIKDLKQLAADRGVELPTSGSGRNGKLLKSDIEQALNGAD